MFPFADLVDNVQDLIDDSSDETLAVIKRQANIVYGEFCAKHPWTFLRTSASVAFTNAQTTGTLLPANLYDIYHVCDTDDSEWVRRDERSRREDVVDQKWYISAVQTAANVSGTDLVIAANGTAATSALSAFGTGNTGEYICIGTNRGFYKVATNTAAGELTISTAYIGAAETGANFEIRPAGTKRMLIDPADAETLTVFYWTYPMPLYNDYDPILLPEPRDALILAVWVRMLRWQKFDTDADKLMVEANLKMQEMQASDPMPTFHSPKNYKRERLRFGRRRW